jgi:uracil-DNA glycosylase family 4
MRRSDPAARASGLAALSDVDDAVTGCRACPRLVDWREHVAATKRGAYRDWDYWGKPVPSFGPPDAALVLVGLAPAAHGGNRTGRAFTGDPSGDMLFAALHAVGLASQPTSVDRNDGLRMIGTRICMPVHCAPPDNKPTPAERDTCRPWLVRELELLRPTVRVLLALGAFAWSVLLPMLAEAGWPVVRPRPRFGHGARVRFADPAGGPDLHLVGCYHPSQRNVNTGRVTPAMLRTALGDAARLAGL